MTVRRKRHRVAGLLEPQAGFPQAKHRLGRFFRAGGCREPTDQDKHGENFKTTVHEDQCSPQE
jgi:hypothetical protein